MLSRDRYETVQKELLNFLILLFIVDDKRREDPSLGAKRDILVGSIYVPIYAFMEGVVNRSLEDMRLMLRDNKYVRARKANVDSRTVREFFHSFHIPQITKDDKRDNETIKAREIRNKLAHGEVSCAEIGKSKTLTQTQSTFYAVDSFLEEEVDHVKSFIYSHLPKVTSSMFPEQEEGRADIFHSLYDIPEYEEVYELYRKILPSKAPKPFNPRYEWVIEKRY